MDTILEQGIFISENEMSHTEETMISICIKFTTMKFEEADLIKSKSQMVKEYLQDAKNNEKEYNSPMYVTGIFSYEKDASIQNWFLDSVESLMGSTISLPTDWVQVTDISSTEVWPLLFSLSMRKIEKERLNIPVAAFQLWEQQDFKTLLKEQWINLGSINLILEKEKHKELLIYCLK